MAPSQPSSSFHPSSTAHRKSVYLPPGTSSFRGSTISMHPYALKLAAGWVRAGRRGDPSVLALLIQRTYGTVLCHRLN